MPPSNPTASPMPVWRNAGPRRPSGELQRSRLRAERQARADAVESAGSPACRTPRTTRTAPWHRDGATSGGQPSRRIPRREVRIEDQIEVRAVQQRRSELVTLSEPPPPNSAGLVMIGSFRGRPHRSDRLAVTLMVGRDEPRVSERKRRRRRRPEEDRTRIVLLGRQTCGTRFPSHARGSAPVFHRLLLLVVVVLELSLGVSLDDDADVALDRTGRARAAPGLRAVLRRPAARRSPR
jgi:hypothetical protein